jgi:hypothetical protein
MAPKNVSESSARCRPAASWPARKGWAVIEPAYEDNDLSGQRPERVSGTHTVAAERVVNLAGGQQRSELDPQGFQDRRWQAGTAPPVEHGV